MPQIEPELKAQLIELGQWGAFVKRREELKKNNDPYDAHNLAMMEFFDNPPLRIRKRESTKKSSGAEGSGAAAAPEAGGEPEPPSSSSSTGSSPAPLPKPIVPRADVNKLPRLPRVRANDFEDKHCSEVEAVRWVADNMNIDDPKPEDCPSAAAWGLLAQCRESHVARADFWKQTFTKLMPSKAEMEKKNELKSKRGKAKEVIDELLSFRQEADTKYPEQETSDAV